MDGRKSRNHLNTRFWFCHTMAYVVVICSMCAVAGRAFFLQVLNHDKWLEKARDQAETTFKVPAYRGSIYDRYGRLLSFSVPQYSLFADPAQIEKEKIRQLAGQLASILEIPRAVVEKKLSTNRQFVWVKRLLTDQQAVEVGALKAKGLNFITEYKRFYPLRQIGGQAIGFVGLDGAGLEGIEKQYDSLLRQDPMTVGQFRDGIKKTIWMDSSPPPEPSESLGVRLTLDAFIQYVAEYELEKIVQQYRAKAGEVVVMDPRTSEVLAIANYPLFDPNLVDRGKADQWRNRAITDYFEPGSTFKVFLVGAALQEGRIRERDKIFCENGKCMLAGHTINDVHPYGWLTLPDVIKHSSNIAASKIALQLGSERYFHYIRGFGFGDFTGINLPGESKGQVRHWKKWQPIDLATTGFGQSIGVTALQLTLATSCLANGGELNPARIAHEITDAQGQTVKAIVTEGRRRVLDPKTARIVCDMMKGVTQEGGTGVNANPDGYTAAGKTGTAQVLDPATRRYASDKYTSLFTGFVPAESPRLAISVAIHEPHGAIYGGVVAAPVFRSIATKVLPYMGVSPSYKGNGPAVPFRLVSAGPSEAQHSRGGSRMEIPVAEGMMPDLGGMSLKMALQHLVALGIQPKVHGSGRVVSQRPEPGTPLDPKPTVELVLSEAQ